MWLYFWLGFVTASQAAIVGAVAYVLYHYTYLPWKVMRKDFQAAAEKFRQIDVDIAECKSLVKAHQADTFSDQELAAIEERLKRRSQIRAERSV